MNAFRFASPSTPAHGQQARVVSPRSFDPDTKIGVIGAGASGLTVARTLMQKGFRHVTVLEREDRVGGKCCAFMYEGSLYELGACITSPHYSSFHALVKELGLKAPPDPGAAGADWRYSPYAPALVFDVDAARSSFVFPVLREAPLHRVTASCLRLGVEMVRLHASYEPGFLNMPADSFVPFDAWARERNLTEAARLFIEPVVTPLGFGYLDEIPAAYVLRYLPIVGIPTIFSPVQGGFQNVWETVARGLDVRRNVTIQRIRRAEQVTVETVKESFTFDALVVTSPFDETVSLLDATPEEAALAKSVVYNDYRVVVASVAGLPEHRFSMFPKHFESSTRGELVFGLKPWKSKDVYIFYAYGRDGMTMDESVSRIAETVRRLGGTITHVYHTVKWLYFPHVSCEALANGFYERLDAMQGARNTYYAGELLAMGTVETAVRQARWLVERHFAVHAGAARTSTSGVERASAP
jgi:predicted NAD/FAD-binding protein